MNVKIKKDDSEFFSGVIFFLKVIASKLEIDLSSIQCGFPFIQLSFSSTQL